MTRPNFLVIVADELGLSDIGAFVATCPRVRPGYLAAL